jgi:hypothetical protein
MFNSKRIRELEERVKDNWAVTCLFDQNQRLEIKELNHKLKLLTGYLGVELEKKEASEKYVKRANGLIGSGFYGSTDNYSSFTNGIMEQPKKSKK